MSRELFRYDAVFAHLFHDWPGVERAVSGPDRWTSSKWKSRRGFADQWLRVNMSREG